MFSIFFEQQCNRAISKDVKKLGDQDVLFESSDQVVFMDY